MPKKAQAPAAPVNFANAPYYDHLRYSKMSYIADDIHTVAQIVYTVSRMPDSEPQRRAMNFLLRIQYALTEAAKRTQEWGTDIQENPAMMEIDHEHK